MDAHPKILVVDDKPENLYTMKAVLKAVDAEVICVTSGEEALRLSLEHDFCLAIVDVQMPGMDGYELVDLFRGNMNTNTLPVIFVSAIYVEEYHFRKGYDSGAVDFLSKPVNPEILLSKVKVFIQLWKQKQELQNLVNQLNDWNKYLEHTVQQRTETLEKAHASLAGTVKFQNELLATATSELRASLATLHHSVSLANSDESYTGEQNLHNNLQSNEKQFREIIDGMTESTLVCESLPNISCKPAQLQEIIASVCNEFQSLLQDRNLTIVTQNIHKLPAVQVDLDLARQLFHGVILHALSHAREDGDVIIAGEQLPAGSLPNKNREAIGMHIIFKGSHPKDYDQWISQVFKQPKKAAADQMKKSACQTSSALGLIIAKQIAEAHDGLLWVDAQNELENAPSIIFHVLLPM